MPVLDLLWGGSLPVGPGGVLQSGSQLCLLLRLLLRLLLCQQLALLRQAHHGLGQLPRKLTRGDGGGPLHRLLLRLLLCLLLLLVPQQLCQHTRASVHTRLELWRTRCGELRPDLKTRGNGRSGSSTWRASVGASLLRMGLTPQQLLRLLSTGCSQMGMHCSCIRGHSQDDASSHPLECAQQWCGAGSSSQQAPAGLQPAAGPAAGLPGTASAAWRASAAQHRSPAAAAAGPAEPPAGSPCLGRGCAVAPAPPQAHCCLGC